MQPHTSCAAAACLTCEPAADADGAKPAKKKAKQSKVKGDLEESAEASEPDETPRKKAAGQSCALPQHMKLRSSRPLDSVSSNCRPQEVRPQSGQTQGPVRQGHNQGAAGLLPRQAGRGRGGAGHPAGTNRLGACCRPSQPETQQITQHAWSTADVALWSQPQPAAAALVPVPAPEERLCGCSCCRSTG